MESEFQWTSPRLQDVILDEVSRGKVFLHTMINDAYVRVMSRGHEGASVIAALSEGLLAKLSDRVKKKEFPMVLEVAVSDVLALAASALVMLGQPDTDGVLDRTLGASCKPCFVVLRNLTAQQPFWRDGHRKALERAVAEKKYGPELEDCCVKLQNGTMTLQQCPDVAAKIILWKEALAPGAWKKAMGGRKILACAEELGWPFDLVSARLLFFFFVPKTDWGHCACASGEGRFTRLKRDCRTNHFSVTPSCCRSLAKSFTALFCDQSLNGAATSVKQTLSNLSCLELNIDSVSAPLLFIRRTFLWVLSVV